MADGLQRTAVAASGLPRVEATELEAAVAADSLNREARARLLGCYQTLQFHDDQVRDRRAEHVAWFIEHTPEDEFTGSPWCSMQGDDPKLPMVVAAWETAVAERPQCAMTLYNAARFFTLVDPARARNCSNAASNLNRHRRRGRTNSAPTRCAGSKSRECRKEADVFHARHPNNSSLLRAMRLSTSSERFS
jgi:hypothetical protein